MAGALFTDRQLALIGLILVGAAPTASVLSSLGSGEGLFGQIFWAGSKLWMLGLPLLWRLKVDKLPFSWSKPVNGGFGAATLLGLGMSFFMLLGWLLFGGAAIDEALIRAAVAPFDLLSPEMYFGAAMFWIFVNSVIEEYVFRWFITEKAEVVLGGGTIWGEITLSAAIFTFHHTLVLFIFGFPLWANALCSLALFIGGCGFSWLYLKYRSIWVAWWCHAICDVVVFGLGAHILFGGI